MKQPVKLLSVVLIVQLVLTGIVWSSDSGKVQGESGPLVADLDNVTGITLSDPEEGTLNLKKSGDLWMLSGDNAGETKADNAKVEKLIDQIAALDPDFPVARSKEASERFKVAEDVFRRKIILEGGNRDPVTLLVGTSPAMGESHVRLIGEESIYRVELPIYQLSADTARWEAPKKDKDKDKDKADEAEPQSAKDKPATDQ